MKVKVFFHNRRKLISFVILGIIVRLIFAILFTHSFDFFNILVLIKSVADTGNIVEGFFVVKKIMSLDIQLYGKIYYQLAAVWLNILDFLKIIDIRYIFDNKGYTEAESYLSGFGQWSPPLYQLTSIKLFQFIYDFIFLFYFIKIATLIFGPKYNKYLVLFWALNLPMIYVGYAMFQSDLAMVAFLTGGIYYAIIASKENSKIMSRSILLMLVFFAIGAVIKQVPILFVIPFLMVISRSVKSFMMSSVFFGFCYVLLSQSYLKDGALMKQFFLNSEESLALFHFRLNDVPIFLVLYLLFTIGVYIFRTHIQTNNFHIITISTILLLIVFISEDMRYFFVQFSIWIIPFLALLTIKDFRFAYFFVIALIGFFRRSLADHFVLTGSLGTSLSPVLQTAPNINERISYFISPEIVYFGLNTIQIVMSIFLLITLIQLIRNEKKSTLLRFLDTKYTFNIKQVTFALASIFLLIYILDFAYTAQHILLTKYKYKATNEQHITNTPITFQIKNTQNKTISGLVIQLKKTSVIEHGSIVFEFKNKAGKVLLTEYVQDISLPSDDSPFYLKLSKTLTDDFVTVQISKEGNNRVVIQQAEIIGSGFDQTYHSTFDNFYKHNPVEIEFTSGVYIINVQGKYEFSDFADHIGNTFQTKPTFYTMYSALIGLLTISFVVLARNE